MPQACRMFDDEGTDHTAYGRFRPRSARTVTDVLTSSFGCRPQRLFGFTEMIFHDLASARLVLFFDRIHDCLVRIHDFLDLCERFPTAKPGANRRFERCPQRTAENLEQIVTGGDRKST